MAERLIWWFKNRIEFDHIHDTECHFFDQVSLSNTKSSLTVQLSFVTTPWFCFAGYAIENEQLGFMVTSYPERNVSDFLQCAEDSVNDLHKVLSGEDFRS